MKRHKWISSRYGGRWRQLDVCANCGLKRWIVTFPNAKGEMKQMALTSENFSPWNDRVTPPCSGHRASADTAETK